jgi:hypothetical protein
MTRRKVFSAILAAGMILAGVALFRVSMEAQQPSAAASAALSGTVRSTQEGLMEGVLVSAKRNGSTITTTVVTNAQGAYSFPRARLEPGDYSVSIRAVGYVLDGPSSKASVHVATGSAAHLNLNLRQSNALELAMQLTDPEWLSSYPLSDEAKFELRDCSRCHTLQRASMSTYNKDQLAWVMKRMVYSSGSSTMTFQLPAGQTATWGRAEWGEPSATHKKTSRSGCCDQSQRGHVEIRAEEISAAQRERNPGDLHHMGPAGDPSSARHAHGTRRSNLLQPLQR